MKTVVLIHSLGWKATADYVQLEEGVNICRTTKSLVEKLYLKMCRKFYVDSGDPFFYDTHIEISENVNDECLPDTDGPYSIISKICNIITICTDIPIRSCRLILCGDECINFSDTAEIYSETPELDYLSIPKDKITISDKGISVNLNDVPSASINDSNIKTITQCWSNIRNIELKKGINHRVQNALSFFFYSWRSYYMEHVCLNLSIVIESLFSPDSNSELTHQLAFNISQYCSKNVEERERIYKLIKKFYSLRSKIVHGGVAPFIDLEIITPEVFRLSANILFGICVDNNTMRKFSYEEERKKMVSEWLFA